MTDFERKDIVILGRGATDGFDYTTLTTKKNYLTILLSNKRDFA